MKHIIPFVLTLFSLVGKAQDTVKTDDNKPSTVNGTTETTKKLNPFFKEQFLIKSNLYQLTCSKSIEDENQFYFELKKRDSTKKFELFDIKPSVSSTSLFENSMLQKFGELNADSFTISPVDKKFLETLNTKVKTGRILNDLDIQYLENIINIQANIYTTGFKPISKLLEEYTDNLITSKIIDSVKIDQSFYDIIFDTTSNSTVKNIGDSPDVKIEITGEQYFKFTIMDINKNINTRNIKYFVKYRNSDENYTELDLELWPPKLQALIDDLSAQNIKIQELIENGDKISYEIKEKTENEFINQVTPILFNVYTSSINIDDIAPEVGKLVSQDSIYLNTDINFVLNKKQKIIKDINKIIGLISSELEVQIDTNITEYKNFLNLIFNTRNSAKQNANITSYSMSFKIKIDESCDCSEYSPDDENYKKYLALEDIKSKIDMLADDLINLKLIVSSALDENKSKIRIINSQIKFENEQLSSISVKCMFDDRVLDFQNRIPIPFSTKKDVSFDLVNINSSRQRLFETKNTFHYPIYIYLDEVFTNDYKLNNYSENYSPKDQIIILKPGDPGRILTKEKVTKILNAKVYSDFLGLNSVNQNGLIQTEVSHRIYLLTKSWQRGSSYTHYGFTNSLMPKLELSKIEKNNKYLSLDTTLYENGKYAYKANIMDLYSHSSVKVGADLNIFYLGVPAFQSVLYLNYGFHIGLSPLQLPKEFTDNKYLDITNTEVDEDGKFTSTAIIHYPEINLSILPHSKLRAELNIKWQVYKVLTDRNIYLYHDVFSENYLKEPINKYSILNFTFLGGLRTGNNQEIFFRSSFNYLKNNVHRNFLRLQVGYAFNLFNKNNTDNPPSPLSGI